MQSLKFYLPFAIALVGAPLVADVASTENLDAKFITQTVGGIISLGFAVWYAYHTTTVTIPGLIKTHSEEMSRLTESSRQDAKANTDRCDANTKSMMARHSEEIKAICQATTDSVAKIIARDEIRTERLLTAIRDNRNERD